MCLCSSSGENGKVRKNNRGEKIERDERHVDKEVKCAEILAHRAVHLVQRETETERDDEKGRTRKRVLHGAARLLRPIYCPGQTYICHDAREPCVKPH